MERWKDMPGFEEYYEISDQGRARSKERRYVNQQGRLIIKHSKYLTPFIGGGGYLRVGLKLPGDSKVYKVMINRKVAEAFIPNSDPEVFDIVGHKDDVRTNNVYTNLYWTTQSENIQKAVKSGRLKFDGAQNANSRAIKIIKNDGSDEKVFNSLTEAQKYLGCTVGAISYAKKSGGSCQGYKVISIEDNIQVEIDDSSDYEDNSCVGQIPVILINIYTGEQIWCNSINQTSRKLNRASQSVSEAAEFDRVCNGYRVIYDIDI